MKDCITEYPLSPWREVVSRIAARGRAIRDLARLPAIFLEVLCEIVRRRRFKEAYGVRVQAAVDALRALRQSEISARRGFFEELGQSVQRCGGDLLQRFNDYPRACITQPRPFDQSLPPVTLADIQLLCDTFRQRGLSVEAEAMLIPTQLIASLTAAQSDQSSDTTSPAAAEQEVAVQGRADAERTLVPDVPAGDGLNETSDVSIASATETSTLAEGGDVTESTQKHRQSMEVKGGGVALEELGMDELQRRVRGMVSLNRFHVGCVILFSKTSRRVGELMAFNGEW